MKSKIFFFVGLLICVSCTKYTSEKTFFCGKILNSNDSIALLYRDDQVIDSVMITPDDEFCFQLDSLSEGLYYLKSSDQFQYVYLEKGDSLNLSVNAFDFANSAVFSGKGEGINNFLTRMHQRIDKQKDIYTDFYSLPADEFQKKADSVYLTHLEVFNMFLNQHRNLSSKAVKIAWASFFFDTHRPYEMYVFEHSRHSQESLETLPKFFYNYRKEIHFNDLELSYYNPFYQYLTHYINNIAYTTVSEIKQPTEDEVLKFQRSKLKIIDTIFNDKILKDNLLRNASYSYLLESRPFNFYQNYIDELDSFLKNKKYREQVERLYQTVNRFQKGNKIPDFYMINYKEEPQRLNDFLKEKQNVFYFWSSQNKYAKYLHYRVDELIKQYPKVNFIGVEVSGNYQNWILALSDVRPIKSEQYMIRNFPHKAEKYLMNYNTNKALIVNKQGEITESFIGVFTPKIEEVILKSL